MNAKIVLPCLAVLVLPVSAPAEERSNFGCGVALVHPSRIIREACLLNDFVTAGGSSSKRLQV